MLAEINAKEVAALQARRDVYAEAAALIKSDPYRNVHAPAFNVCVPHVATNYIDALVRDIDARISMLQSAS